MTDDLENLRRALDASTPDPNAEAKVQNLSLAHENFDRLQESAIQQRPTSDRRPFLGWLKSGVARMFHSLTSRGGLAATTALVAVGLFVLTPQGRSLLTPPPVIPIGDEVVVTGGAETANAEVGALNELGDRRRSNDVDASALPARNAARELEKSSISAAPVLERTIAQDAISKSEPSVSAAIANMPTVGHGYVAETDAYRMAEENTEAFANEDPNPLKVTVQDPVSTFSIDVDTASYAVIRSSLTAGMLPPPAAVRVEEMINYFPYDYPGPALGEAPFRPTVSTMQTPWNPNTRLIHIALQGRMPDIDDRPPLNLVFLIDTSGSMQGPDKLPLLKQSFRLMLGQLRPTDQVAIVTYAGSAGQVLEPTDAAERSTILRALDQLQAGGSTAGQAGLQQAYSVAESMAQDGEVTRVILATDGDFN
ncbi:MAG: vWA domain-containing protein, partial [Paracoccaceae bacterium]